MRSVAIGSLALVAGLLILMRPPGADAQPEVTFFYPEDGDILVQTPPVFRLCFANPVNIQDFNDGGDFRFRLLAPEDRSLGLRIVFRPDALGVDIHPGLPQEPVSGEWTFEWRVTDPDTLEPTSGTVRFTVDPDGAEVPEEPPQTCDGASTPAPDASPTPTADADTNEDDGGTDVLLVLVIVIGAVGGAAVAGAVVYNFVRRRRQSGTG